MSLISVLSHFWSDAPTQDQVSTAEELLTKASTFIEFLEAHLPDDADRQAALHAMNQVVMHSHVSLARLAEKQASDASSAEAAHQAEAASQGDA